MRINPNSCTPLQLEPHPGPSPFPCHTLHARAPDTLSISAGLTDAGPFLTPSSTLTFSLEIPSFFFQLSNPSSHSRSAQISFPLESLPQTPQPEYIPVSLGDGTGTGWAFWWMCGQYIVFGLPSTRTMHSWRYLYSRHLWIPKCLTHCLLSENMSYELKCRSP